MATRARPGADLPAGPSARLPANVAVDLLEHAPDAILGVGADGAITLANRRAEDLLGHRRGSLIGAPVERVLPGGLPADERVPTVALREDGSSLPVELRLSLLPTPAGPLHACIMRDVSERLRMEADLRRSQQQLTEAQSLAKIGSWEWDIVANRVAWSDELFRIYGHEPQAFEPTYDRFLEHVHPDDRASVDARNHKAFADHLPFEDVKSVLKADGTVFLMRTQGEVVCDGDGNPIRMLGVCEDVTVELRAAEAAAWLASIVHGSSDAIYAFDGSGTITSWNPGAERLFGWRADEMIGRSADGLVSAGHASGETQLLARDGEPIHVSLSVSPIHDAEGRLAGTSVIARDITERKRFEERLQWLADHDALTGLYNRRRFEEELEAHCARVARTGESSALMMLDLDGFKYVNDTGGHSSGDQVIRGIAQVLKGRLRASDVIARLGGDEFAVLLGGASDAEARAIAGELLEAVRGHVSLVGGTRIRATTSIGVVIHSADTASPEELLAAADGALYDAKDAGRDRFVVHSEAPAAADLRRRRLSWGERLHAALDGDHFELYCQPIMGLAAGGGVGRHELLLRMNDGRDVVAPGSFLGAAERLGLVRAIDRWVAVEAVRLLATYPHADLAINMSARSIDDAEVPALLEAELDSAHVDPTRLMIEITETAAIANIDEARRFAGRLHNLGCRFALDDFGTGFGSFSYLKHLPVDELKIDGEFVRSPRSDVNDLIVDSIVRVAHGLGKRTIAEWVGDDETVERMRTAGVDFAQGYAVGRPVPAADALS